MNATTADARSATFTDQPGAGQLRRSGDDRMLAGLAGGIARYLNADVTLVRVIIAALTLFTGVGAALYLPPGCSSPPMAATGRSPRRGLLTASTAPASHRNRSASPDRGRVTMPAIIAMAESPPIADRP
jgi:phage shock protein PspC (stress-responsive transcriptional regulator)